MSPSPVPKQVAAALSFLTLLSTQLVNAQALTSKGCYSAAPNLALANSYMWQTSSHCQPICVNLKKPVMGLSNGSDCYCGDELPPASDQADSSLCTKVCDGFGGETCGNLSGAFNVWLTGLSSDVGTADGGSSSAASSSTPSPAPSSAPSSAAPSSAPATSVQTVSAPPSTVTASQAYSSVPPSVITVGGSTVVKTVSGQAVTTVAPVTSAVTSPTPQPSGGSKVGVAVGVVVGVIAGIALIAGVVFFLKKRRSTAAAERHRRLTSVNAFATAGSPPAYSTNDSRLDQTMVERRNSTGSIFADNEDYSRRILKVTNPDG